MDKRKYRLYWLAGVVWLGFCPAGGAGDIESGRLLEHIRVLSSDEYEGRAPGSRGEDLTVEYLTKQFRAMGLKPGNPDGTYVQEVPLVGFISRAKGRIEVGGRAIALDTSQAWVPRSRQPADLVEIEGSEVVFVGYGVVAPEYSWDDYKGLDVRGKTLMMLVNDPPVPEAADSERLDESVFGGRAMTYYGRWTYKYEMAGRLGAKAVLLVHEAGPAGYPYEVPRASFEREEFDLEDAHEQEPRVALEAWISLATAEEAIRAAGLELADLKAKAARRDFRPVELGAGFSARVQNERRRVISRNVLGRLEGSDATLRDESVVFTAHWDHLGRDDSLPGDSIYNGAADNASGVAGLLELARVFQGGPAHRRSLLFLAVTAEEKGLLGSRYYANRPLHPLEKTVAVINMDVLNLWGRTRDLTSVGLGQSTLDDLLAKAAAEAGRTVAPDPEPEKGFYYRSDHFEFAKVGVPALNAKGGMSYRDKPEDFGRSVREQYTAMDYHKPSDEVKAEWDLSGAVEDLKLLEEVARRVANAEEIPEWLPSSEFRARREEMLRKAAPSR